jgi:hypothetical protein
VEGLDAIGKAQNAAQDMRAKVATVVLKEAAAQEAQKLVKAQGATVKGPSAAPMAPRVAVVRFAVNQVVGRIPKVTLVVHLVDIANLAHFAAKIRRNVVRREANAVRVLVRGYPFRSSTRLQTHHYQAVLLVPIAPLNMGYAVDW